MSRLRSSKLWRVLRGKAQPQPPKPAVIRSTPNNTKLPIEILELIFAHLDIFALLRCRSTCHVWASCIPSTSPSILSTLFLTNPYFSTGCYPSHKPAPLEFIVKFAPNFAKVTQPQPATQYTVHTAPIMTLNGDSGGFYEYNPLVFFAITQPKLRRYRSILARAAKGNSKGELPLWMKMYATSPPVRTLALRLDFHGTRLICDECWVQQHRTGAVVEDPDGVTVGKVLERLCDAVWWPDMILSETEDRGGSVRVIAREEGEGVEEETDEGERRRVSAAVKEAGEVRWENSFLPSFGWGE